MTSDEKAAALRDQIRRLESEGAPAGTKKVRRSEVERAEDGSDATKKPGSPGTRSGRGARRAKRSGR